ncbi:hypothetical protein LSH36_12g23007 [Paralvinella palmiformis]|uniref:Chitin-binding type-2 domain-containing protein n=1 Tax=Paralvinella palmiformis TaxID=53620 RepID=A0AAD9NG95_9ANNE|nr:hypothetical protein LSH36_12g23007 [Paralvinella palmiformis]
MIYTLLSSVLFGVVFCQDCTEGEICCEGCRSYRICQGGEYVQYDCVPPALVYNYVEHRCTAPEDAPPPCGDFHDCSQLPDASYPDMSTNCTFFFTCLNGIDYGLQTCNPGLVFSYETQTCNWPDNVKEPCGNIPTKKEKRKLEAPPSNK